MGQFYSWRMYIFGAIRVYFSEIGNSPQTITMKWYEYNMQFIEILLDSKANYDPLKPSLFGENYATYFNFWQFLRHVMAYTRIMGPVKALFS